MSRTQLGLGAFFASTIALGLGVAGCVDDRTAETQQPIIGGTADTGDPAIVALYGYYVGAMDGALCTCELIAPQVLLTAAHCVDPAVDAAEGVTPPTPGEKKTFLAFLGDDLNDKSQTMVNSNFHLVAETHFDPLFDIQNLTNGHDIAVAILNHPITTITPIPYQRTKLTSRAVKGKTIRLVGYGLNDGQDTMGTSAGTKRTTTTKINSYGTKLIGFGSATNNTCQGDSGGPALYDEGGVETIIGVTSFGPRGCAGDGAGDFGDDTRVDDYTSFIDGYVNTVWPNPIVTPTPMPTPTPTPTPSSTTTTTGTSGATTGTTGSTSGATTGTTGATTGTTGTSGATTGSGTGSTTGSGTGATTGSGTTGVVSTTGSGGTTGDTTGSGTTGSGGNVPLGGACQTSNECTTNLCAAGYCASECTSNRDCSAAEHCATVSNQLVCVPGPAPSNGGCSTSGSDNASTNGTLFTAFLLLGALALLRRRRLA